VSSAGRRYATAVVESAAKQGEAVLEKVTRDLESIAALMTTSPDLRQVLLNPVFSVAERKKALDAVIARLDMAELAKKVVELLSERNRLSLLGDVARSARRLSDLRAGRVRAKVETAAPLTGPAMDQLKRALERRTGKSVEMTVAVVPSLLGGVRTTIGSMVLDGTIRSQLDDLREQLLRTDS